MECPWLPYAKLILDVSVEELDFAMEGEGAESFGFLG